MCTSVCAHSGEWMKYSAAGHYTVVSSASVLWVRNTAALTPQTTHYSKGPKRPPTLPLSPSLATRDLDLQLCDDYFMSPDSLPSIVFFFFSLHTSMLRLSSDFATPFCSFNFV